MSNKRSYAIANYFHVEEEGLPEAVPEEVEEESLEEESVLTEYDPDEFYSSAVVSLDSTIPVNLFEFKYPFI